jgi:hypothetical protein
MGVVAGETDQKAFPEVPSSHSPVCNSNPTHILDCHKWGPSG